MGVEVRGEECVEGEYCAGAVSLGHFVEQLAGVTVHAGFAIESDKAGGEPFVGDIGVLLLVVQDVADAAEALRGGQAANGVLVDAGLGAEAVQFGGLLELVDEAREVRFLVEVLRDCLDAGCGGRLRRGA